MSSEIDIGPLSWVKSEIDLALGRTAEALNAYGGAREPDRLAEAGRQLHQAQGALSIVGLAGVTEFAEALEALVAQLASGGIAWSGEVGEVAQAAVQALRDYLDALMAGEPNQALRLLPALCRLEAARGHPQPDASSLFFPDLSQRPPRRETEPAGLGPEQFQQRARLARTAFERGLLKWIKGSERERGITEMRNAVALIEGVLVQPVERAVWWSLLAVFEALADGGIAAADALDSAKKLCLRVGQHIKHLADGQAVEDEPVLRHALYLVGIARSDGVQVATVRAAYRLQELIPRDSGSHLELLRPQLGKMRELVASAKEEWNRLCGGAAAALPPFHEHVTELAERARTLGRKDFTGLTQALMGIGDRLRRDPSLHNESVGIEVATALLLAESALENFKGLGDDFTTQANTMVQRLQGVLEGADLSELMLPHLDDVAQRAQERLLMHTVSREVLASLATVEQALDAFFRDPSRHAELATLAKPLRQVEGALTILGQERAVSLLGECITQVAQLAENPAASTQTQFETLARTLSGIGFFVEQLESGARPDLDAILAPVVRRPRATAPVAEAADTGVTLADVSVDVPADAPAAAPEISSDAVVVEPTEFAVAPAVSAVPAPLPPAEEDETELDAELLEIFIEEAREVVATIAEFLPQLHHDPRNHDAMVTLRRSFHTLKGSGRMVGLSEFGEAAWGVEQAMNLWLQEQRPADADLLAMLDHAGPKFGAWVEQLAGGGSAHADASELAARCAALLGMAAPPPVPAAPAVAEGDAAAEPSAADMVQALEVREREAEEASLAAAEIALAEAIDAAIALPPVGLAVPPAPTLAEPATPTIEAPAPLTIPAVVSDEELLAAELAAAEAHAVAQANDEAAAWTPEPEAVAELAPELPSLDAQESDTAAPALEPAAAEAELPDAPVAAEADTLSMAPASEPAQAEPTSAEVIEFPAPPPIQVGAVEISPTLFAIFMEEANGHLATLLEHINDPGVPRDAVIRAAHTLGSTAGTTGITAIHHLARALELALGAFAIVHVEPAEAQRLLFARAVGALEGMLGAVREYRLPAEEFDLADELKRLHPDTHPPAAVDAAAVAAARLEASVADVAAGVEVPAEEGSAEALPAVADGEAAAAPSLGEIAAEANVPGVMPAVEGESLAAPPVVTPAAPAVPAAIEAPQLVDEIDPDVIEIFFEESADLMASVDAQLRGWRNEPGHEAFASQLKRDLHTLKGSARMAGAMNCGELFHRMESRIEQAIAERAVDDLLFDALEGAYDRSAMMIERLQRGELAPLPPALEQAVAEVEQAPLESAGVTEFALPTSGTAPPPKAPEIDESEPERRAQRIADEIDEQLLPIFLEESGELMASISSQLRQWREHPENEGFAAQLKRDLHTIKGSARMAGAMGCGDLFHSMESRIEQAQALRQIGPDLFDGLDVSYDRGIWLIERLQRGEFGAPAEPQAAPTVSAEREAAPEAEVPSPVAQSAAPTTAMARIGEPAQAVAGAKPAARSAQVHLRVRADQVDSLVNEAGEVAIARARIEGEMRALKSSLLELTDNVIRLRNQVREIEIEAETQMASQINLAKEQAEQEGRTFDPLEFDRFTRFQELTRMMAESVNDVSTIQANLLVNLNHADAALVAQSRLNRELSERLMGVRMVPFESQADRLHRVVRQAAKDAGKRVNLDIRGGQMGVDRSVLEHITGPLEHLLRNAVGHGIESVDKREAAGKPALGQITLTLAQEGNDLVLAMADDGGGLNLDRIRARAVERGLLAADAEVDERTLVGMIFQSGFSTAEQVTTLSGRGVGMDVVKNEVEALGGHIEIATAAGKGSVFRLFLPLTLAVSQAVIIVSGTRRFALPASMIEQASEMKPEAIAAVRAAGGSEHLGHRYPYHYLPRLLGQSEAQPVAARRHWLLLVKGGAERLAIEIDGMVGNQEIVLKNLGPQLARIPGLAGATVLGDGEIALILNPIALAASAARRVGGEALAQVTVAAEAASEDTRAAGGNCVMVVDDSLTVRKITGRLLARHGYEVVTAKDGVDALEQLQDMLPNVMLLDIEMPRMDGFELARNIRGDAKLKGIPIVMITSRTADKHRLYAEEIGVNHYIGKPYNEELLLELVARYTRGGNS